MTIRWTAVEKYFAVVLFAFQFNSVCNFGKFIDFGLGTARKEKLSGNENREFIGCKGSQNKRPAPKNTEGFAAEETSREKHR